jgi:hypothetical protein
MVTSTCAKAVVVANQKAGTAKEAMTNLIGVLTTLETGNLCRSICCADVSRDLPGTGLLKTTS